MPPETPYSIADLARLTDVTPRTVRYYIAQGLLRPPGESGPGAHYGAAHLDRLQLIRRLQRQHLPLAEIRTRLAGLTDHEIHEALRTGEAQPEPDGGSALDYIRTVLGSSPMGLAPRAAAAQGRATSFPLMSVAASPPPAPALTTGPGLDPAPDALRDAAPDALRDAGPDHSAAASRPAPPIAASTAPETPESTIERSQWERLSLGPNVELHIRRPLSRLEQKRVDRLITIARQVLQEATP